MGSDANRSFKYIFIPADTSEPIQEREMSYAPGQEVECLLDAMKDHFRSTAPAKSAAQLAAQRAELVSKLPAGTPIDENLLSIATDLQMVENIALLSHSREYSFIGVNLYVDDEGSVRGAPRNVRATEIAHCCGKPIDVRGDTFLARVFDNGDDFERMDLKLSEVSSGAEWVAAAKAQAAKRAAAESSDQVLRRMQEEAAAERAQIRELTPAEAAKEEGNAAFKKGDWAAAAAGYTRALELEPNMVPALNNRSMALLKMEKWAEAEADAAAVLARQPSNVKALLRAATAARAQCRVDDARTRLEAALSAEPANKEAQRLLGELGVGGAPADGGA